MERTLCNLVLVKGLVIVFPLHGTVLTVYTCDHGEFQVQKVRPLPVGENGEKYLGFPYLKCCFEAFTVFFHRFDIERPCKEERNCDLSFIRWFALRDRSLFMQRSDWEKNIGHVKFSMSPPPHLIRVCKYRDVTQRSPERKRCATSRKTAGKETRLFPDHGYPVPSYYYQCLVVE